MWDSLSIITKRVFRKKDVESPFDIVTGTKGPAGISTGLLADQGSISASYPTLLAKRPGPCSGLSYLVATTGGLHKGKTLHIR